MMMNLFLRNAFLILQKRFSPNFSVLVAE